MARDAEPALAAASLARGGRTNFAGFLLRLAARFPFLLLAARNALVGGPWHITALLLALSFPAHLADLARRGW